MANFVNFWNPQTYHFFYWLTKGDGTRYDPAKMVAEAISEERVEIEQDIAEGQTGLSLEPKIVAWRAVERLECKLHHFVEEAFVSLTGRHTEGWGHLHGGDPNESLFYPMLSYAVADIRFYAVAQALMIHQGALASIGPD